MVGALGFQGFRSSGSPLRKGLRMGRGYTVGHRFAYSSGHAVGTGFASDIAACRRDGREAIGGYVGNVSAVSCISVSETCCSISRDFFNIHNIFTKTVD